MSADTCPVVKIMPARPSQGAFVEINAEDFDPARHVLYCPAPVVPEVLPPPPPPPPPAGPLDNLPPNWRSKAPQELRSLASTATGRMPENKSQAIEMIEAAIAAKEPK
jgi:hypothetical protein